jgi:hypothetical protein
MKNLAKLALGAAMLSGLALTAMPASAAVVVGVGIGGPGHARHWCWRHPGACHNAGYVAVAGPRIGVFYHGRGWWDGHRYWGHRERWHGGWRYR